MSFTYNPLTGELIKKPTTSDTIVGGGDAAIGEYTTCTVEVEGGCAGSIYLPEQKVDAGGALG